MSKRDIAIGTEQQVLQGALGAQGLLVIAAVPATGDQSLVGEPLAGKTLTVNGLYRCLIPLAGLASLAQVHVTATFSGGTVATDLDTLFTVGSFDPSTWVKKTNGSGTGNLTSTVRQTSTLDALAGERYAVLDITLTGAQPVTFTQAEYNGL